MVIISILLLFIIPEILGLLFTRFMKENNVFFAYVIGYIVEFAILQLLAIPMILLDAKFTTLLYTWSIIVLILVILSIILNIKNISIKRIIDKLKKIFDKTNIICFVAILFISVQIINSIVLTHTDEDDAFYLGTAITSINKNSLFRTDAYTGEDYEKLLPRYVLAPFSLYISIISYLVNVHPIIVAHTIIAPVFIGLVYVIYTVIGLKLFKDNKKDISLFLILMCFINIFGGVSVYTNSAFLLFRIWQGKAILANIMLPMIWVCVWNYYEEKNFSSWLIIFLTSIATCLMSEMGINFGGVSLFLIDLIFLFKNRKIKDFIYVILCEIPYLVYFSIYLIMTK